MVKKSFNGRRDSVCEVWSCKRRRVYFNLFRLELKNKFVTFCSSTFLSWIRITHDRN
ncbi:hypothetical protein EMIT093MI4_10473 [Pseudomonas sp. IT-93MI4]